MMNELNRDGHRDGLTCPCLPAQTVHECTCGASGVVVRMVHDPDVARVPRAVGGHP